MIVMVMGGRVDHWRDQSMTVRVAMFGKDKQLLHAYCRRKFPKRLFVLAKHCHPHSHTLITPSPLLLFSLCWRTSNSALLSHGFHTPPFLMYGDIYSLWTSLGEANNPFGLPIANPQLLVGGSTYSILRVGMCMNLLV